MGVSPFDEWARQYWTAALIRGFSHPEQKPAKRRSVRKQKPPRRKGGYRPDLPDG